MERALGRKPLVSLLEFENIAIEPTDWNWKSIVSLMEIPSVRERFAKVWFFFLLLVVRQWIKWEKERRCIPWMQKMNMSEPNYTIVIKNFQRACSAGNNVHMTSEEKQVI